MVSQHKESNLQLSDEQRLAIWQRAIETQMHFAELSIKMRQIGLTLAGATVALAIVLYRTNQAFSIEIPCIGLSVPAAAILCISAAIILYGAKILDVDMYHRMLRGAVRFNELYEQQLDELVGWKSGLTEAISAHSRYKSPKLLETRKKGELNIWEESEKSSLAGNKINRFYHVAIGALSFSAVFLIFANNV